jgi:hypothetical protein
VIVADKSIAYPVNVVGLTVIQLNFPLAVNTYADSPA